MKLTNVILLLTLMACLSEHKLIRKYFKKEDFKTS